MMFLKRDVKPAIILTDLAKLVFFRKFKTIQFSIISP